MKTIPTALQIHLSEEAIRDHIYVIRNQRVMMDRDLAKLYRVETRMLKQAIKRNIDRFPPDFMFELRAEELNATIHEAKPVDLKKFGGARPFVFTEQGVAMLSSILNSPLAIEVNIQIIRIFVKIRHVVADQLTIRQEITEIREKLGIQDKKQEHQQINIELIFKYLDELQSKIGIIEPDPPKIGYKPQWD